MSAQLSCLSAHLLPGDLGTGSSSKQKQPAAGRAYTIATTQSLQEDRGGGTALTALS